MPPDGPEILTRQENRIRHELGAAMAAASDIQQTLLVDIWTEDRATQVSEAAMRLQNAASRIIDHADTRPFHLSTVLSVWTFRLVAASVQEIEDLVSWLARVDFKMGGGGEDDIAITVACRDIVDSQLSLNPSTMPAIPAMPDAATTHTMARPQEIIDWVADIAAELGFDDPDPIIPIRRTPPAPRLRAI